LCRRRYDYPMGAAETRWKPSLTVAAVIECDGRYLLVEEHTPEGLRLNNPAGHLEPGESPQQAAVREVLEETGRRFEPHAIVGVYLSRFRRPATGEDITFVRIAFAGSVGEPEPGRRLDAEIVRTLWCTRDEIRAALARHRSPLLMRCVDDHARGRAWPLELISTDPSVLAPDTAR
jgi:phosphatase NudJ